MNNTFKLAITFAVGAAIGSAATWYALKEKYRRKADEEIESVKKAFIYDKKRLTNCFESVNEELKRTVNVSEDDENDNREYNDYHNIIKKENYCSYKEKEVDPVDKNKPHVISPDDFGELDDYQTETLIYYADGYLVDENDDIIDDIDALIGKDSLNHFGEYEEDSVFVRNDKFKIDYEILRDEDTLKEEMEDRQDRYWPEDE